MPITKRRPGIMELLNTAVDQRKKLHETKIEILERPASIWLHAASKTYESEEDEYDDDGFFRTNKNYIYLKDEVIKFSRVCEKLLCSKPIAAFRTLMGPLAFAIMAYEVQQLQFNNLDRVGIIMKDLDRFVNAWFLVESLCRLMGSIIRVKIEEAFKRHISTTEVFFHSGFIDVIVTCVCFRGLSEVGLIFRIVRLYAILSSFFELIPQLDLLQSGVSNGLRTVVFTLVVFFLVTMVYASLGHHFFAENDPLHFGTYGLSFITFFQLSTFDSWSEVFYVNAMGCDSFPDEYQGNVNYVNGTISTMWGTFDVPVCDTPVPQPVPATLIFISYSLIAGFVIVSMCLAAVAIGINERLASLKTVTLYGDLGSEDMQRPQTSAGTSTNNNPHSRKTHLRGSNDKKMEKLLGKKNEGKQMVTTLHKIWEGQEGIVHHAAAELGRIWRGDFSDLSFKSIVLDVDYLIKHRSYEIAISLWILGEAILQLTDDNGTYNSRQRTSSLDLHWMFQIGFIVDSLLRALSRGDDIMKFLHEHWNIFDVSVTLILFIPLAAPDVKVVQFLCALRLARLARILETLSFISDLKVILTAISSSFMCLLYVFVLLMIYLVYFALAGVLLFKRAAPFYFGATDRSIRTLYQIMTLDGWSDVMRKCMFGCEHYGFITGVTAYDNSCKADLPGGGGGQGVGHWAPIYFITYIIFFSMVLCSLLVGVIITSVELLREGAQEEAEIWEKVSLVQRRYGFENDTKDLLLTLFEKLDLNENATLSFDELSPVLSIMDITEVKQFEFYMKVDADKSGKIDFSEFCEMIMLIGLTRGANASKGMHTSHMKVKNKPRASHKGGPEISTRIFVNMQKMVTGEMDDDCDVAVKDQEQIERAEAQILQFLSEAKVTKGAKDSKEETEDLLTDLKSLPDEVETTPSNFALSMASTKFENVSPHGTKMNFAALPPLSSSSPAFARTLTHTQADASLGGSPAVDSTIITENLSHMTAIRTLSDEVCAESVSTIPTTIDAFTKSFFGDANGPNRSFLGDSSGGGGNWVVGTLDPQSPSPSSRGPNILVIGSDRPETAHAFQMASKGAGILGFESALSKPHGEDSQVKGEAEKMVKTQQLRDNADMKVESFADPFATDALDCEDGPSSRLWRNRVDQLPD